MNTSTVVMPVNDYPHGPIVCMDCDQPIPAGSPYSLKLDSVDEAGMEWSDVVCATGYCKTSAYNHEEVR